jgi:hypothetical protein
LRSRYLFLIFALSIFPSIIKAQKGLYMGVSANAGTAIIANQNLYGVKWYGIGKFDPAHQFTVGYGATAKIGYNFSPPMGLLLEVGYQHRGQKYEDVDSKDITHKKEVDLEYFTTGIYFRYTSIFKKNYYKKEQKVRLAVVVGPQFSTLLKANQTYGLENDVLDLIDLPIDLSDLPYPSNSPFWSSDYNFEVDDNDKELFKNFNIGLLARVGVDIYPKPWFFISPTISTFISVTDINSSKYTQHSGYGTSRIADIGFDLGVGFYIDSKKEN